MSNEIFDAENRHQHYLERFKTGEVNSLSAFLKKVEQSLIQQLSQSNTFTSRKRIRTILDRIRKDSEFFLTEYVQQLALDLDGFGEAEAEFTATALSNEVSLQTTVPTAGQVATAAKARPFTSKLLLEEL
ncbi:MAG TPA: hypothetical protein EYN67_12780, partial [Flavobacteriales bacterium]|nr:hypothetical protein [Flavobacteriales bacterium]